MNENDKSFGKEEWQLRCEQLIREINPHALFAAAQMCDGHTIWNPEAFIGAGLPAELVNHFNRVHMAAADGKHSKWGIEGPSGNQIEACKGVYGLELLELICEAYGIPSAPKRGRGTSARWYIEELRKKLGMPEQTETAKKGFPEVPPEMKPSEEEMSAIAEQFAAVPVRHLSFAKLIKNRWMIRPEAVGTAVSNLILAHQPKQAGDLLQLFKHPKLAQYGKEMKLKENINSSWSPLEEALSEVAERVYKLLRRKQPTLPKRSWRPEDVTSEEELIRVQQESLLADDIINNAVTKILGMQPSDL